MSDVVVHETLAAALAWVQGRLPKVAKGETAKVEMKGGGSYSYTYADLADVSDAVLPLTSEAGLAWMCKPTVTADGRFVLAYSLKHVSGEREDGEYPLPTGTPQQVGSAITYARRYCLCAVVGVAPDGDDDGQAAEQAARARPPEREPEPPSESVQTQLRALILTLDVLPEEVVAFLTANYGVDKVAALPDAEAAAMLRSLRQGTQRQEKFVAACRKALADTKPTGDPDNWQDPEPDAESPERPKLVDAAAPDRRPIRERCEDIPDVGFVDVRAKAVAIAHEAEYGDWAVPSRWADLDADDFPATILGPLHEWLDGLAQEQTT